MEKERILKLIEIKFPNLTANMKEEYYIEIMGNVRKTGYENIKKRIKKIEIKKELIIKNKELILNGFNR